MESIEYLSDIEKLPTDEKYSHVSVSKSLSNFDSKKSLDISIETVCGTEAVLLSLFNNRNVSDTIFEAYRSSFTGSEATLYEHYASMLEKGESATNGFINNLKGKVYEIELHNKLENIYPNYDFEIAADPTNPIWDIKGININDGTEILVQAKMGTAQYASDVIERMQDNPDVLFATSVEIHDKILSSMPELSNRFIDFDISNYDFSHNVNSDLNLLTENLGIDVPDSIGDLLPYISEIVLGIRLILDLISVQRDYKAISANDKKKISAVKTVVLLSRFGVSTICTFIGGSAGTASGSVIPGIGNLIGGIAGSIAGAVTASKLNKYFKPYIMEIALGLVDLDEDDMFYFRNKIKIDKLAVSFSNTTL